MLYRLVYLSSYIGIATEDSLRNIFETAARNNVRDDITGFIIFYEGNFFQVMEGAADKVEACFSRIGKDRRHRMPTRLSVHSVEKREFSNWEALYYLTPADADGGEPVNGALRTDGRVPDVTSDPTSDLMFGSTSTGPQSIGAETTGSASVDPTSDTSLKQYTAYSQSREVNKARLREILSGAENNSLSDDLSLNVFVKNFLYSFRDLR